MTFRDKPTNKFYAFALAAVFAIALAGCGGGGGGGAAGGGDDGMTMPGPAEPTAAEMAATEAASAASAAKTIADGISDDEAVADEKAAAMAAYMAASAAATAAQTAADADDEVEARVQQRMAENARDDAQMYATAAAKVLSDATSAAARAAVTKVANTKKAAIATEADSTTTLERPFDGTAAAVAATVTTSDPAATTKYALSISHKDGASAVSVRDERNLRKADPTFSSVARFGDGQMLVRDNSGTSREIIVIHTDIEAPTATPFGKVHTLDTNDNPDTTAVDNRSLTIATAGALATDIEIGDIDLGVAAPGEDATSTKDFAQDDTGTPNVNEGMHRGRFDGAMGTYLCTTADCSVTVDDEGTATALAGTWQFTPDAGVTIDVADTNYLYYGFWLDTTTKDGAVTSYDTVQTFAGSGLPATTKTLDTVTGSAEYTGGATGVYVHEVAKPDGTNDYSTSGRFTADVYMHVHFDGTANRVPNSMRGSISNFELEHGEEQDWNVTLRAVVQSDFTLGGTGITASGMQGDAGSLTGEFHSASGEVAADAPAAIVGEFNANFVNGSAVGAYGARLDE